MPELLDDDWMPRSKNINVFVSYAHKDRVHCEILVDEVKAGSLRDIATFHIDDGIRAGAQWREWIDDALRLADVVLLLLTPSFLASEICVDVEARMAMKRAADGSASVFGVLVEECDYEAHGIRGITILSADGKAQMSSGDPPRARALMGMKIKYAAYERFEQRHETLSDGSIDERGSALVMWHQAEGRTVAERGGCARDLLRVAGGALIGWATWSGVFDGFVPSAWTAFLYIALVSAVVSILTGVRLAISFVRETGDAGGIPMALGFGALAGMIPGLPAACIVALAWYGLAGKLTLAGALVSSAVAGLRLFEGRPGAQPKRLVIHQELVAHGLVPPGGWRIDRVEPT